MKAYKLVLETHPNFLLLSVGCATDRGGRGCEANKGIDGAFRRIGRLG